MVLWCAVCMLCCVSNFMCIQCRTVPSINHLLCVQFNFFRFSVNWSVLSNLTHPKLDFPLWGLEALN